MRQCLYAVALAALCAACGSNSKPGSGTAVGTVNGASLNVADASFTSRSQGNGLAVQVLLSSFANVCYEENAFFSGTATATGTYVEFLTNFPSTTAFASGANVAIDPCNNTAQVGTLQAGQNSNLYVATGGSVRFTSVNAAEVTGTYALTFDNNQTLTGAFTAPVCVPNTGSGSATGSVSGLSVNVVDATFQTESQNGTNILGVLLTSVPGACYALAGDVPSTGSAVELLLRQTAPLAAGTYTIDGNNVVVEAGTFSVTTPYSATAGTITISSITSTSVAGSYHATFANGALSGAFSAKYCAL